MAMDKELTFGDLIRQQRKNRKLTTAELAVLTAVDRTYITKIERHNKLPSMAIMYKICDKLGDDELFKKYLKIKYPTMYEKFEKDLALGEIGFLGREFREIKAEVEKIKTEEATPKELKILKDRILFFGSSVNRSLYKLESLIGQLARFKKLQSNLKNTLEQKK